MNRIDPAPTPHLIRGKASVVQPPPVEEFSRAVCCCRPSHDRNRFDDFMKFVLAALQPLIPEQQFSLCCLGLPEIEIVINRERNDTVGQAQEADVFAAAAVSGRPDMPRAPRRRCGGVVRGPKYQWPDFETLGCNPLLQPRRHPFILVPICNVEWFLCRVCPP